MKADIHPDYHKVLYVDTATGDEWVSRSTITSKGQVTIPKAIRDRLGLAAGDTLEFTVDEEGRILARPSTAGRGLLGILRDFAPDGPISVEAMKEAVRSRATRRARDPNG